MTSETTALVRTEYSGLQMHCSPAEARTRMQELKAFVAHAMVRDVDYGVIPGAGDKPTLFQPGAQKLCEMYGLAPTFAFEVQQEDWGRGFFYYRVVCTLTERRSGAFVGNGYGSCNSKESKYAYRWLFDNEVPEEQRQGLKRKQGTGKNNKPYTKLQVPNDDIFSQVNTIQKMACKRALVHAVIGVTRSAGVFGQDKEDLPPEVIGEADEHRSWEPIDTTAEAAPAVGASPPDIADEETFSRRLRAAAGKAEADAIGAEIARRFPVKDSEPRQRLSVVYLECRAKWGAPPAREPGAEG